MKLAASKVDFRIGCEVGVKVVLVVPGAGAVEGEGIVVVLAVELVGNGAGVGAEQKSVRFTTWQPLIVELCEQ